MKKLRIILVFLIIALSGRLFAQQIVPFTNDSVIQKIKSAKEDTSAKKAVTVHGIASAEALQFENLNAAGSLSATVSLGKNITGNISFNFGAEATKNQKADSVPLSLFYFPDVANTAFLGGIDFDLFRLKPDTVKGKIRFSSALNKSKHHVSLSIESSIQRRNVDRDSLAYQFGIFNVNAGPKYRWVYAANNHYAVLTLGVFYNHIRINRNNSDAFNTLFNDYKEPAAPGIKRYFHGISVLASLQLDKVTLFARTFTDLNRSQDLAFTVGIRASADFFSF